MFVGHSIADASGKILGIDTKLCELLEREKAELLSFGYIDITHPDDVGRNIALIERLCDAGSLVLRKRYLRPDRSSVWVDVSVSRLNTGRDAGRLIGTIFKAAPSEQRKQRHAMMRTARRVQSQLNRRRHALGEDLFMDYPWLILVEVYLSELEGRIVDSDAISEAVGLRLPTTIRWLKALEAKNMIDRDASPFDSIQLTCDGLRKVGELLDMIVSDDLIV